MNNLAMNNQSLIIHAVSAERGNLEREKGHNPRGDVIITHSNSKKA